MRKTLRHSAGFRIGILAVLWLMLIAGAHLSLNKERPASNRVRMGYMPVVANMACPLVDYATKGDDVYFEALKFSSFSEMGDAFRSGHLQAAFIIAPLALMLFEQGVPLKIVYIGNRHESTMVVRNSAGIHSAPDLIGKKIAVPIRYSGHYLALKRYLREQGLSEREVAIVEVPPPEMPVALASSEIDGYLVGEPFGSKSIEAGIGKRFLDVESIWPDFICNLLIVRQELIDAHPEWVLKLVETAACSGLWARDHTEEATAILSSYWGQDLEFIRYVFSNPPDRFRFDLFTPVASEVDEIAQAMRHEGFLKSTIDGRSLVESSFARAAAENYAKQSGDFLSSLERNEELQQQAVKP
jgi:NitT/TauT family transport system substrate-binding protein